MQFGVLGLLEVRSDNGPLTIKGVKERRLLGLLLSRANSAVPVDHIIEALWGSNPPPSAAKSVQVYVVRVRKMLASDGVGGVVSRQGAGYMLRAARDHIDALQFADLVAQAGEAAAAGAHDVAALVLRSALALWRGAPYADFQDTWFGVTEAAHLGEVRLAALEARIEADLALGRHAEVTAELETLVREHPLRERLWAQLMLALYRSGRQSEALLAFQRARRHLVGEIGVEPGPALRAVETAVLAQDPGLAAPDPRAAGSPELPAGLRRAGPLFAGRDEILSGLRGFWAEAEHGRGGVVLVCGPAGSGRTRLAAELAHHAHARGAVVHLAGPGSAELTDLARPAGPRPVLVVLDDADRCGPGAAAALEAAADTAPPFRTLVLATYDPAYADARLRAVELRTGHARRMQLPPLDDGDAAFIVQRYAGARADADVVRRIVAHAHGLPGRLQELAAAWLEEDASLRVAGAVSQAPAARHALSLVRATVREGVLDLHRVKEERAARAGAGGALCPYKGLARFEKLDAAIFHGREALVATLVARLADTPLVAVVGPSGAGKSSTVRAGLLPALTEGVLPGSGDWPQHVLLPGGTPRRLLAPLLDEAPGQPGVVVVDQFEELFISCRDEAERAGFVEDLLGLLGRDAAPARVVLTIRADYVGCCAAYPALAARVEEGMVLVAPMTEDEIRRAVTAPALHAGLVAEDDLVRAVVSDVRGRPGGLPLLSTALLDTWERRRGRTLTHAGYLAAGGVSGALARLADAAYARLDPAGQQAARRMLVRLAETGEGGALVRRRVPAEEVAAPGDQASRRALDALVARRLLTAGEGTIEVAHEALLSHWPRLARWLEEDEQGRMLRRHLAPAAREWAQSGRPDAELYRGARLANALDWAAGHAGDLNPVETEFLEASRSSGQRELRGQQRQNRRLRALLGGVAGLLAAALVAGGLAVAAERRASDARDAAFADQLGAEALLAPRQDLILLLAAQAATLRRGPDTGSDLLAAVLRAPRALHVSYIRHRLLGVAVSPDGRVLVVSDNEGEIRLLDAQTLAVTRVLRPPDGNLVTGLAFSADGQRLVSADQLPIQGARITVREVSTGRVVLSLAAADGYATAITPDGTGITSGASGGSYLWRRGQDGWHRTGYGTRRYVTNFSRDGAVFAVVASGSGGGTVLRSARTGAVLRRLPAASTASGATAALSPDGRVLATSDANGAVRLWDTGTGRQLSELAGLRGAAGSLAFSPSGRLLLAAGGDGTAIVWKVATGHVVADITASQGPLYQAAFAPDEQTIYTVAQDGTVASWDLTGRRGFGSWAAVPANAQAVAASPGGGLLLGTATGQVTVLDPALSVRRRFTVAGQVTALAVNPAGRLAAAGTLHGTLYILDLATGAVTARIRGLHAVGGLGWSPDGRLLAATDGQAHRVQIIDTATWRTASSFGVPGPPGQVAWSADGKLLAIGILGSSVEIADPRTGHLLRRLPVSRDPVAPSVAFTSGATLAVGARDGSVRFWDAATGTPLSGPIPATTGVVLQLSASRGGGLVAASGYDGSLVLLDAAHYRRLGAALPPPAGLSGWPVLAVVDSRRATLIAVYFNGQASVWPLDPARWLARACTVASPDLTPGEWRLYLGARPYKPAC